MIDYILKSSLEQGSIIRIIYEKDNEITQRDIKVLALEKGLVKAFCMLRNEVRYFSIDKILSAEIYRKPYTGINRPAAV